MSTEVPEEFAGQRLDWVVARLTGMSRSEAKAVTASGSVLVNGTPGGPPDRVPAGARIEFPRPSPAPDLRPEEVPFDVRYEDDLVAVVDKPSGIVTHPGAGVSAATLAAGLIHRWPELEGVGEPGRWGLVHRLDRDTSGLVLVAKTPAAFDSLRGALAAHTIRREYEALARGRFDFSAGTIDAPVGPDPRDPTRRWVEPGGKPARTNYRVVAAWEDPPVTRLMVSLDTGRTHQIRVHLASISHPLVGDPLYGRPGLPDVGRLWLHARQLAFVHPGTGEKVEVEAPLPPVLAASLEALGPPSHHPAG